MSIEVDPVRNAGHRRWSPTSAPPGADPVTHVFWRCDDCGAVVGFWRHGLGSSPSADETAPPDDVGVYAGSLCPGPALPEGA